MKKIISFVLVAIIIISTIISATAIDSSGQIGSTIENNETISAEEKISTTVNINDNFKDDEILVVLNNSASLNLKEYSASYFSEIPVKSIENLTRSTDDILKAQQEAETIAVQSVDNESTTDESSVYVDEENYHQFFLLKLSQSGKENVINYIKILEQRDDVILAMPNYIDAMEPMNGSSATLDEMTVSTYATTTTPNDYTGKYGQWGIEQISLPEAWSLTTGSSTVIVGVIDSGINSSHEDLSDNIATSSYHENFIDDGISALSDPGGHGTQVAGVIAAVGNNGKGTVGACWNVKLASLKVFTYDSQSNEYNTTTTAFVKAIIFAKSKGIKILNYSSGGSSCVTDKLNALLNYNGLFVCPAGNDGVDITQTKYYPACYDTDNMIVVAKGDTNDALASDASYSSTYVDLSAPGMYILTTDNDSASSYVVTEGSSISAPYVTGVAALLKSRYPGMDAKALKDYIESNVDTVSALSGKVKTGGRLNAYKALTNLKRFTVRYIANGGGGQPMSNSSIIYGCATALSSNAFSRSGYTFTGWQAQRVDTGEWYYTNGSKYAWYTEGSQPSGYYKYTYRDGQKVSRTTTDGRFVEMYAQWEKKFNIEFYGNNATSGSADTMTIVTGDTLYLPGNVFTRSGCTLDHWYAKDSEGNHYCINDTTKEWYSIGEKPSGYTRIDYAKGSAIVAEDINGIEYDDTIKMCAYWEPNSGVLGDADMSGSVNTKDATFIQKYLSSLESFTDDNQFILADVDFDGSVTAKDATLIQKYVGEIVDEFGV